MSDYESGIIDDTQQQVTAQPAQPGQRPSFWRSLLGGALYGLAASKGATSFGGGLAAGAAGDLAYQEQQKQDQLAQDANTRANADEQAHQAQMALAMREMSHRLHLMDPDSPEYVAQTVSKLADDGDAALKAGAVLKSPVFDSAAELEDYTHNNHYAAGNYQVRPTPFHDASGKIKYAAIEAGDAPTTQDTVITYKGPDGKDATATVPAGTPKSKLAQFQAAAANQQVGEAFKEWQENKKQQHAAKVAKASTNYGYAEDDNGNTVLSNEAEPFGCLNNRVQGHRSFLSIAATAWPSLPGRCAMFDDEDFFVFHS